MSPRGRAHWGPGGNAPPRETWHEWAGGLSKTLHVQAAAALPPAVRPRDGRGSGAQPWPPAQLQAWERGASNFGEKAGPCEEGGIDFPLPCDHLRRNQQPSILRHKALAGRAGGRRGGRAKQPQASPSPRGRHTQGLPGTWRGRNIPVLQISSETSGC